MLTSLETNPELLLSQETNTELLLSRGTNTTLALVTSTSQIRLRTDGSVDDKTFLLNGNNTPAGQQRNNTTTVQQRNNTTTVQQRNKRTKAISEKKTVAELGVVIFTALDFGLKDQEERQLSPALENILDLMTSADDEMDGEEEEGDTDDEGIGEDHDHVGHINEDHVGNIKDRKSVV